VNWILGQVLCITASALSRVFSYFFIIVLAAPRTPLALRAESGVKGALRSGALLEDP